MCVGVWHATSSVEKSNAFNPIDCFHFPCESLTKFHYSRREASRNIVEVLEVTSWNDQAMASPYGPVVKKRYDMGVLPHDHRACVSGGYITERAGCHRILVVYMIVSHSADAFGDVRFVYSNRGRWF